MVGSRQGRGPKSARAPSVRVDCVWTVLLQTRTRERIQTRVGCVMCAREQVLAFALRSSACVGPPEARSSLDLHLLIQRVHIQMDALSR